MFSIYDDLPLSVRPTYFFALRAALVGAVAGGVGMLLQNIATSILHAGPWQLALLTSLDGAGMILAFFWGGFAARRPKMPLVFWPRVFAAAVFFALSWVGSPLLFCALVGTMGLVGNIGAPAAAGITSSNYPARLRGMISGFTQRWAMLISVSVGVVGAEILQRHGWLYRGILPVGGLFALAGALIFLRVKVRGEGHLEEPGPEEPPFRPFAAFEVLARDGLFRTYMFDFFFFGLANLMMLPVIYIILRDDFGADFREIQWTNVIIPAATGIATAGFWGRVIDRSNPVSMRAWMNVVWVVLPLSYLLAPRHPVDLGFLTLKPVHFIWFGSFVQGSVAAGQGLVWTLGTNYFARREDVPLYQGVHIGLTGVRALVGPFLGPAYVALFDVPKDGRRMLCLLGSAMMILSASLMFRLAARIRRDNGGRMPTFADKEAEKG
jgi:MFS family permease